MKDFILISSLGFSIIASFLLSIYASIYIKNLFDLGDYVVIIGILMGLLCGILTFVKIFKIKGGKK